MQSTTLEAACLGKLPTHGDFVRHRASTPTMRAFDEWIRNGLHRARKRHSAAWDEAYDNAPTTRFFFSGRGRQAPNALLGVLQASRDRNGRTYPFTVTCEIPKSSVRADDLLAYLPLHAKSFYTVAEQVVQDATDGTLPYRKVADRVAEINPAFTLQSSPPTTYNRYVQQHTMGRFLKTLFGHFDDGRKYRLFKNLLDIYLPQQKRATPRLNYGLQFPLGDGEPPLTPIACFWLDASLRLVDHPDAEWSFFWTPQPPTTVPSFLLLFLGAPRANAFFHLLASDEATEEICKLERMGSENDVQAALSLPEKYGSLLEDEQLPLRDFLQHL